MIANNANKDKITPNNGTRGGFIGEKVINNGDVSANNEEIAANNGEIMRKKELIMGKRG